MNVSASAPTGVIRRRSPFLKIVVVESKIMSRDAGSVFFSLIFPALLLTVLGGVMPGFLDTSEDLGGLRPIDVYGPVALGLAIATVGIANLPSFLATYREAGVLRRLATTPASPSSLLQAQLVVNLIMLAIGSLLALASALVVFDVRMPGHVPGMVVAWVLGTGAAFAIGLVIAAVAKNARAAQAIGMTTYFPMLFFAGVWTPGDTMPDGIRAVADYTPLGAATEAMADAWIHGEFPGLGHMAVLLAWAVAGSVVAARLLRWE